MRKFLVNRPLDLVNRSYVFTTDNNIKIYPRIYIQHNPRVQIAKPGGNSTFHHCIRTSEVFPTSPILTNKLIYYQSKLSKHYFYNSIAPREHSQGRCNYRHWINLAIVIVKIQQHIPTHTQSYHKSLNRETYQPRLFHRKYSTRTSNNIYICSQRFSQRIFYRVVFG